MPSGARGQLVNNMPIASTEITQLLGCAWGGSFGALVGGYYYAELSTALFGVPSLLAVPPIIMAGMTAGCTFGYFALPAAVGPRPLR